ncbi:MAG: polyribonucleotide nucleotidyltransferase [Candidatus Dasytiphilus stammeri]
MINPIIRKFQYGQHIVTLETGRIAKQATAAVLASMDDTTVLVTIVGSQTIKSGQDFFPLSVNYQERSYAAGRIPGSFFRREGRPSETEILVSRLIDRPIRPLFPEGFLNEVQIIATVVSVNPKIHPDIVAIIGTSAALSISGIPFRGPIGAARVGYLENKYILNPSTEEVKRSYLNLVIAGTKNAVLMVEAEAKLLSEEQMLEAIIYGHEHQQVVIKNINSLVEEVGKIEWDWTPAVEEPEISAHIANMSESRLSDAYQISDKHIRSSQLNVIKGDVISTIKEKFRDLDEHRIHQIIYLIEKNIVRKRILRGELRLDGRTPDMVRKVQVHTPVLQRTHGSALFTRGETQALVSVTLGTDRDAQNVDELTGDRTENFIFHYNFPPYSVGEIGIVGFPKRREIGHGRLAKRGLLAVMPCLDSFPYTIRIVSEITESNGSSSMASICGASLALMDAGVPIKAGVAGIAMGLVKEGDKYSILSDILGDEDQMGDMDFKVAGTRTGITALQMDIKIEGINKQIMSIALKQALEGRLHILNIMEQVILLPRKDISIYAPRMQIIKINPDKIKDLIGKGGTVIRSLTDETETIIEIEDDGTVKIAAPDSNHVQLAILRIQEITAEIEVGKIYHGKVTRIVDFGAFITILGISSREGLVHISQISARRIDKVSDHLKIGQKVNVKVLEVDRIGRIRLSIKQALD